MLQPARPLGAGRPQPGHVAGRPRLNLVPPLRTGAPRAPFVVLLGTLLIGGLAGLLFLHTALAEDSFRLHDLKNRSALLTDREQALEQLVAVEASPRRLSARAEALGMVRSENPAFIRLSDGKVLGKAKAGVAPPPPRDPGRVGRPVPDAVRDGRRPVTTRRPPPRRPRRPAPSRAGSRATRQPRHVPPRPPRLLRLGDPGRRLRGGVILLAFVLSLFGARLVQLQGLDAPTYAAAAEQGRLRTATLPATRGTITDRNGVALATTVAAVNITSDQTKVVDPAATAAVLAPVLEVDPTELRAKLTGDARFVYVAKTVTPATWRSIRALDHPDPDIEGLPGIYAEQTSKRVYPAGHVGANVVGFVGAEGKGLGGIEYALDSTLAGRDGTATYELSAGGRRIPSGVDTERDAVPGTDVRLTIDRDVQYVAQKAHRQGGRLHPVAERDRHRLRPEDRRSAGGGHRAELRPQPPRARHLPRTAATGR